MADVSLAEAFTREHHEIDAGIEEFLASTEEHPRRRAGSLVTAMGALRRHIYLEEEIVFPHLPAGPLMMALLVMRREHGELWRRMDALAARLDALGGSDDDVIGACQELLALLATHNAKEEPIIYPHIDANLSPDEQDRVRTLLADGDLPAGWTCQEA